MRLCFNFLMLLIVTSALTFAKVNYPPDNSVITVKTNNCLVSQNLNDKGQTQQNPYETNFTVSGFAEPYFPLIKNNKPGNRNSIQAEKYWKLIDSVKVNYILPAGGNMGALFNPLTKKLEIISPFNLTSKSLSAIAKAPNWIRPELEYVLSRLSVLVQDKIADVIILAQSPYIDEVCFAIANSTPQYLSSAYCYPQLFLENAEIMYRNDEYLRYVEIVDYGEAGFDNNFYSTVKYLRADTLGNISQVEVPADVYYNFLVHPKITDEIQAYIDPMSAEHDANYKNHIYNIKAPPQGKFWRDFLFNFTELKPGYTGAKYPILKDSIFLCDVLWDDANKKRSAIWEITKWINEVMDFDNKQERPHQPNRIYKLHLGRCGEHEDITAAAARSCLVPCRGIEASSSDHVWNEYWDIDWQQWEPVNNSMRNKFCYSKGWGKKFGTVFCHESKGVFTPVTDAYCENISSITIYALDALDNPIDGASITLAANGILDEKLRIDVYGITDCEGKCVFKVESGHTYYARMDSPIGSNPATPNQVAQLTSNPLPGEAYSYKLKASGKMPAMNLTKVEEPGDSLSKYRIDTEFECKYHYINWLNLFDDLSDGYTLLKKDFGRVNFIATDKANFDSITTKAPFSAHLYKQGEQTGDYSFFTNTEQPWYFVLNNGTCLNNAIDVNSTIKLYELSEVSAEDLNIKPSVEVICTPNPVTNSVKIHWNLPFGDIIKLEIININGETIRILADGYNEAGEHSYLWDTKDENGNLLAGGIYFYVLKAGAFSNFGKIAITR